MPSVLGTGRYFSYTDARGTHTRYEGEGDKPGGGVDGPDFETISFSVGELLNWSPSYTADRWGGRYLSLISGGAGLGSPIGVSWTQSTMDGSRDRSDVEGFLQEQGQSASVGFGLGLVKTATPDGRTATGNGWMTPGASASVGWTWKIW